MNWVEQAACRGASLEVFYAEGKPGRTATGHQRDNHYNAARRICIACPVATACLDYAMSTEAPSYRYGMWGGLTPAERHSLARGSRRYVS